MGACFGAGVRGMLPYDLITSDEDALAFMIQFAKFGISNGFRDVIGDRVVSLAYKKGEVIVEWLDDADAAPILERYESLGGSASYSSLEAFPSDDMIFLPSFRGQYGWTLNKIDEEHPFYGYPVAPLRNAIKIAERSLEEYREEEDTEMDVMLLEGLLEDFLFCKEHKLIYHFGY